MKWVKNLKIRQKILSAFLLVSLFIAGVNFIGLKGLELVRDNAKSVYENNMIAIQELDRLNDNLLNVQSNIFSISNNNLDTKVSEDIFTQVDYMDKENQILLDNCKKIRFNSNGERLYDNFRNLYTEYIGERNKIIKLIKNGDTENAKKQMLSITPLKDNMFDALSSLINLNIEQAEKNDLSNDMIYRKVSIVMRVLVFVELLVAIFLGIYISKYISDHLEKGLKFAKNLSDGKLTDFIEVDTKDEFGILARKLNKAAKNTLELLEELTLTEEELRLQMDELHNMNEKLMLSEERYRLAVEGANDGIWDIDVYKNKMFISDKFKEIVGLKSKGNTYDLDYCLTMIFGNDKEEVENRVKENFRGKQLFYSFEFPILTPIGEQKYVLIRSKVIWNGKGKPVHVAGSLTDITHRKKAEKTIENMAYYNAITELPNRTYAMTKLRDVAKELLDKGQKFAVFFLDMDNFKTVNDTLGHAIGDKFLKKAADRFKTCLREGDIACHLGGDEFVFLISSINNLDEINEISDKILSLFRIPFDIDGYEIFYVTSSMGISVAPEDGDELEILLKNADTAMYYAKNGGKNKYEFFTKEMNLESKEKVKMKKNLRSALSKDEFTVYYQPKVNVRSGEIVGMEALIRWMHPIDGMIPPSKFIPLAEETGLIVPIGECIIRKACLQNKAWQETGKKPLRVAVNLSIKQLQRKDIVQTISQILEETKLEPKWLEIEITESMVMENFERAIEVLSELKNMGIQISLDDFGTGYSSLNYLRKLPINAIKIDKSFVDGLHPGSKENFIAATLINLAHGIGIRVIAEGVENAEQVKILSSYNCDQIQGYYFSKPIPAEEFEKLLEKELYKLVVG